MTNKFTETYPYTYVKKNGEVQERLATITVEEREWRRRWLKFTKLFAVVHKQIDISLDKEIGEKVGSYKGGVTGFSEEMYPNEGPLHTLRRAEEKRRFN